MRAMSLCYRILFFSMLAGSLSAFDMLFGMNWRPHSKMEPLPSCPQNELYRICMSNCSNCEERGRCFSPCKKGCDCMPNFVRLTPDGPCEHVALCPKTKCGDNEVFRACGPTCELCANTRCQAVSCDFKCYCKSGYYRNQNGICVPESKCPKTHCRHSEIMGKSGPVDEYCVHGDSYILSNETRNVEKCYCWPGYKRNTMGFCINETRCEQIKCLGEETFYKCIPRCNTTCINYGDPDCEEDDECYPGCFCPAGYVMNDYHRCVRIENCNSEPTPSGTTALNSTTEESDDSSTESDTDFEETYKEIMKILLAARAGLHRSDLSSSSSTTNKKSEKYPSSTADGSTTSFASSMEDESDSASRILTTASTVAISKSSTTDKSVTSSKSSVASSKNRSTKSSPEGGSSSTSAPSAILTDSTVSAVFAKTTTNVAFTSTTASVRSGRPTTRSKFARTASTHFDTSTASIDMLSTEKTDNFELTEEDHQESTSEETTTAESTTSYTTTKPPKRRSKISAKRKAASMAQRESRTTTPDPDNWDNDF